MSGEWKMFEEVVRVERLVDPRELKLKSMELDACALTRRLKTRS